MTSKRTDTPLTTKAFVLWTRRIVGLPDRREVAGRLDPATLGIEGLLGELKVMLQQPDPLHLISSVDCALDHPPIRHALMADPWFFAVWLQEQGKVETSQNLLHLVLGEVAYHQLGDVLPVMKFSLQGVRQLMNSLRALIRDRVELDATLGEGAFDPIDIMDSIDFPVEAMRIFVHLFHAQLAALIIRHRLSTMEPLQPWMAATLVGMLMYGYRGLLSLILCLPTVSLDEEAFTLVEPLDQATMYARHGQWQLACQSIPIGEPYPGADLDD